MLFANAQTRKIVFINLLVISLLILATLYYVRTQPLTVRQAWIFRSLTNGHTVKIRGFFGPMTTTRTLALCDPPRCDCNRTEAKWMVLSASPSAAVVPANGLIESSITNCTGDECSLTCSPVDPTIQDEVEVVGKAIFVPQEGGKGYPDHLFIDDIDYQKLRRSVNGRWEPVPMGEFIIPVATLIP